MTQIITNTGLGVINSSLGQLAGYGPKGKAALGQSGESVYLNVANGNLVLQQTNGFLASMGLGLELIHSYNSFGEGGKNWRFNTQTCLLIQGIANQDGSVVTRIDEDGHSSQFIFDTLKGRYLAKDGGINTLIFNNNRWSYQEGASSYCYEYNLDGQLSKLRDRDGHQLQFNYHEGQLDEIIDDSGHQTIKWTFNQQSLQDLTVVSDGEIIHHLHYIYDEQNRLRKVSRDLGQGKMYWISYNYAEESNRISAIYQSDGTSLFIDYDNEGRVKKLIDGENRMTTYQYYLGKTLVTNGLGEIWTYLYDEKNRLTGIDGPENSHIRYLYEGNYLTAVSQGNLHWVFSYNESGDCIRIQEPSGQITHRIYDNEHRLLNETCYTYFNDSHHPQTPQTSRFIYDERGHLRFKIAKDGTVSEYRYNQLGQCLSSRIYMHSGYNPQSLTSEQNPKLDELLHWVEGQSTRAISLIDYQYDWRGLLEKEIHYTHINAQGEGLSEAALITCFRYDAAGRLLEKSVPTAQGFSTTSYLYDDLGRLIQSCDNQKHYQRFEYDDDHQRIIETDAKGLQTIRSYDHSGLLLTTQYLDSKQLNYGILHYSYDEAGRLLSEINADGSASYYFYDHEGRLRAKSASGGQLSEYRYDNEGRLLQTICYFETITTTGWEAKIPEWSTLKPKANPKDRIRQTIYNDYNQIAYQIDAEGAVLAFEYDTAGQIIRKTAYASRLSNYITSQILNYEQVQLQASKDDRSVYYFYDNEGRLQAEVDGEGAAISFRYDRAGHLCETIRYANPSNFPFSSQWKEPRTSSNDIHSFSLFNDAGLKIADIDPMGFTIAYKYNERGLLVTKRSFSTALTKTVLGSIHETTLLSDLFLEEKSTDHLTTYCYDDLDQLVEEQTQNGLITQYRYDEKGLMIEKTITDAKTNEMRQQRFRYDAMGRIIQRLDALGATKLLQATYLTAEEIEIIWQQHSFRYDYDLAGRLRSLTNALDQITHYFYNDAGLLRYTVNAEGQVTENQYNGFNQIILTYRYSKLLKEKFSYLSTTELATHLSLLRDDSVDEHIYYEYNNLGQLVSKSTGSRGLETTKHNAFGEVEETHLRIDFTHELEKSYCYDRRGLLRHQVEDGGGFKRKTEIEYDVFGRIEKTIDGRGGITSYLLNRRGERIVIENQAKNKKLINYDAFGRILTETDYTFAKIINSFQYDDQKNLLTLEHPGQKSKIVTQFNAFGDKITVVDANGQTTRYQYDAKGQLLSAQAPEGATKQYGYDEIGNLIWQQDGGQIIRYRYDAAGRLLIKTLDPDGLALTTRYRYDGIGRQLEITEANGLIKRFRYDNCGNLIESCIDPDGLNLKTAFYYDDRGLLTQQTDFNLQGKNKVTAYEWDALGRRKATVLDPNGLKLTTSYCYDENDNLISQTDANNNTRHFIYDAKNQCRFQIDARGVVTEHLYDLNGNEIQTAVYANRIAALDCYIEANLQGMLKPTENDRYQFRLYDAEGRLTLFFDAMGYATSYAYDGNGNLLHLARFANPQPLADLKAGELRIPNGKGARHQYFAYNGLNQLVYQLDEANYLTRYSYHANGQLNAKTKFAKRLALEAESYSPELIDNNLQTSFSDQCTRYAYDQAGRLSYQLSAHGVATAYSYDGLGNTVASLQYATRLNTALLSNNDWVTQLLPSNSDRITRFIFDSAGREVYRISAEGRILERGYDALGNVIKEITHQERVSLANKDLNELSQLLAVDSQDNMTVFDYDVIGRLRAKIDARQQTTLYRYDNNSNVLNKIEANLAEWSYVYDEANQLIETHSPCTTIMTLQAGHWVAQTRSVITHNTYDSFGNIIVTTRDPEGLNQTIYYVYDNNNRKSQIIYPNVWVDIASNQASPARQEQVQTLTEEQQYNAFGELIASKDRAGNWRYKAYDSKGQLVYSLDSQGALTDFNYDAFGNLVEKTRYANCLTWSKDMDCTVLVFAKAIRPSSYDRKEYYSYDLDNHLIETIQPSVHTYNAATKHYDTLRPTTCTQYNAFGEVTEIAVKRNEIDWARTRYYYDKDGLKLASLDAENYLTTYSYNSFGELTDEIQYANRASYWDENQVGTPMTTIKDRHVVFTYDALGQLISKTLRNVSYQRLINGSNNYETETADLTTRFTYDATGHLTSTIDPLGFTAYCYYDALGQLIAKVGPITSTGRAATSYSYDALGQLVEVTRFAQGAIIADQDHFVINGPSAADISTHTLYDNQGRLIAEIDGLNHLIQYSYDANGQRTRSWQIVSQVDGSQRLIDKRYSYDAEGHLLQTATFKNDGQLMTENSIYNAFGEMTAKGIDGNLTMHMDYDNLGRLWRSNMQGYYQIYAYDLIDHITQVVTSSNAYSPEYGNYGVDLSSERFNDTERFDEQQWQFDLHRQNNIYDGLGRCLRQGKESTVLPQELGQAIRLENIWQQQTVDRWGNVLSQISARGFETCYEYNAFDEVIKQELPEVTAFDEKMFAHAIRPCLYYAYDALGRAIAMTDANGHTVAKILDAEGKIIAEVDAKGKQRFKIYNLFGQLVVNQNELGGVTTYIYDKANRLISISSPKNQQAYSYDETGALIAQRNALGQSLLFWYDNLEHQIAKRDVNGRVTTSIYDDSGHKIVERDANGRNQSWVYDAQGRLQSHTDLGGHTTAYHYNKNGLLLDEFSTAGKSISYRYQGDGHLLSYSDNVYHEVAYYSYDADGNMIAKSASRTTQGQDDGWIRENDVYAYDALGRLAMVRRRHPEDKDNRFPAKDHALLNIDYHYDAVSNIRHTAVETNYTGYQQVKNDDYFTYDANNRMLINKGVFSNGEIILGKPQSSYLDYDDAGNVKLAWKVEDGTLAQYGYLYNSDNQLELISKNGGLLKAIHYDALGRIDEEQLYDAFGHAASITRMDYVNDLLRWQTTRTILAGSWQLTEKNEYNYDTVGNLQDVANYSYQNGLLFQRSHHYTYEYWDSYLQSSDKATLSINGGPATQGLSVRYYNVNGQLFKALDGQMDGTGLFNSTDYKISTLDGIRARIDKNGQTSYLTVAGKTIGDLQVDRVGRQQLNVYGGFSPTGNQRVGSAAGYFLDFSPDCAENTAIFLQAERFAQAQNDSTSQILVNTPQDNIGAYTVQAGDNLDNIALQFYGDSSLWYLIADANGLNDRFASDQLHSGQRLIIPQVATRQHFNNSTQKIISSSELIGDTSPSLPLPNLFPTTTTFSPPRKSHSLFKKIAIAAVTVIATVLAAAAFATLAGVLGVSLSGLGSILHLGMKVLAGKALSMTGSLAAGFTAGVTGNLAGQGLANALGLQKGLNLKGSLVTGLSTAASAGLLQGLSSSEAYTNLLGKFNKLSSSDFSLSSAAQMMEEDAISQGVSLALQNHQHFNWSELATKGILGGITGSIQGQNLHQSLTKHLGESGGSFIHSELNALASTGLQNAMNGEEFNASQVLRDNLGSAIGAGFVNSQIAKLKTKRLPESYFAPLEEGEYCPILQTMTEERQSPIPAGAYQRFHQEAASRQLFESITEKANALWNDYSDTLISYGPKLFGVWGNGKLEEANENSLSDALTTMVKGSAKNWLNRLVSDTWEEGKIENRLTGVIQATEGTLELAGAATLIGGSGGIFTPLGYPAGLYGADNFITGIKQAATGEVAETQTRIALQKTPLSEQTISLIDTGLSMTGISSGLRKIAWRVGKYGKEGYLSLNHQKLTGVANWNGGKELKFKNIVGSGVLGGVSGGFATFATGGDIYDIGVGALSGSLISIGGAMPRLGTYLSNPYIAAGVSNFAGQSFSHLRDPQNNHYSLIYFGFSLTGASISHGISKQINVAATKAMIDSIYSGFLGGVGNNLGKRTGW